MEQSKSVDTLEMYQGLEVTTTHRGKPDPSGSHWSVVPTSWLFWPSHEASSAPFVPKKLSKSFVAFGELLFLHKETIPR